MKILFLGDYSNVHACVARQLKQQGHDVTVVSDRGGFQLTHADRVLSRRPGLLGGVRFLYDAFSLLPELSGYDAVQLINPHFWHLRPGKLRYFLRRIREKNGPVYLTLAGNDTHFVRACREGRLFRFSEYRIGTERTEKVTDDPAWEYGWLDNKVAAYCDEVYSLIKGAMAVLPEYDMAAREVLGDRCHFTNIPIDLSCHPFTPLPQTEEVRIAVGMKPGRETQKGTDRLLRAARELEAESGGAVKVERLSGLPYRDYLRRLQDFHIVLDQLYAYAPATNALDAMALGRVAGSGGQQEYYDYIGETERRPVIALSPLDPDLTATLRRTASDREALARMAREGREIVERCNDSAIVARRFLDVWQG